jgi:hypothetical protein
MIQTLILFQKECTNDFYLWNGVYPITITGGWENNDSPPWNPQAEISEKETELFKKLEGNKARGFETKERGRFTIMKRINIEIDGIIN